MNCEQMQRLFSPYLDKMTTATENEAIAEHLGECAACAQQMQEMDRMCALLKNLDTPPLPVILPRNSMNVSVMKRYSCSPLLSQRPPNVLAGWLQRWQDWP